MPRAFSVTDLIYEEEINNATKITPNKHVPVFERLKEASHLNCSEYFEPNANFTEYKKHRVTYKDPENSKDLPTDCESIRNRTYFQTEDLYPEEKEFPIAFARAVFADYRFLEMELGNIYAPQNFYCFALDAKASPLFHERMRNLSSCFPNVYLTTREFKMDSTGKNMGYSLYECMNILAKKELNWKYLVFLQNYDSALKTNQELLQIFKWFNGTNDIASNKVVWKRINKKANWTFEALRLFKNESRNRLPHNGFPPTIQFSASLVQVSVSRAMIDFIMNELDLSQMMKQMEWGAYGIDEIIMGTLNSADAIDVPGGYSHYCTNRYNKSVYATTRLTYWNGVPCLSGLRRHSICIPGLEHMRELSEKHYLSINKFVPALDMGAAVCWQEKLFNRTHFERGTHRLNPDLYLNLPYVRFNRVRNQKGKTFDVRAFNCSDDNAGRIDIPK
ncbi:N-acetyllactosaminide beta-1,6-N-acetylglucosaminyl-transferase, isoform C [Aphelenchoides bicaudatus]|nr:N-acetyllactosaminide beta-1,6-N-acetylglucosaminyl-transferase, isoform C [Aphelenchoides bicaudatus]